MTTTTKDPDTRPPEGAGRTDMPAWLALRAHSDQIRISSLRDLFDADKARAEDFTREALGIYADFSKNQITHQTLQLLSDLAAQCGLREKITAMFAGEKINTSEQRAALHVALRAPQGEVLTVDGANVVPTVHGVLDKMADFATQVRNHQWLGQTGRPIRTVINIGIGGSDLGPRMAQLALRSFGEADLQVRFVSNIDGAELAEATADLDPAETLFVVCSKTWRTQETLTIAASAREWILAGLGGETAAIARHFVAVSTNTGSVGEFGIDPQHMFEFWDWVGGRYSLDSAVGLSLMLAIGPEHFAAMLAGFHDADEHFRTTPIEHNIPALMGLLSVWYNNFLGAQTQAILPYSHDLADLPAYLQQLEMESNGKHVTSTGRGIDYQTGQIIWGQPGTNGQHAFYQLLHQGTKPIPCDFIGIATPLSALTHHHDLLIANLIAQTEGLAFGRTGAQLRAEDCPVEQLPHRVCEGNRPSTTLLLDALSPYSLGVLIGFYEHKVFTEAMIWDVDPFDQWGVELGKILARAIEAEITADHTPDLGHDGSTNALIRRYRTLRGQD